MKRILQDKKIVELLKEYNSKYELLNEAKSKLDVLINKFGIEEENAKVLNDSFGPLSIWMANKIGEYYSNMYNEEYPTPKVALSRLFLRASSYRSQFASIKDYIAVGLNGNKSSLDNLDYREIYIKSKEWHDALNLGEGEINYIENAPILIDFRDKNGEGYYWADLNVKSSEEECKRMGHCGRSSYGYLYSLRSDKLLPGGKFKLNRSHLTAAIGTDGILYQLKGTKNSKPKEEYHQYIEPLFNVLGEEEDYLIKGFGTEYASEQDFKLTDLPDQTIRELYKNRPEIFNSRSLQRKLGEMGILTPEQTKTTFTLQINSDNVSSYLKGNRYSTYKIKNEDGREITKRIGLFEKILKNDVYDLWQGSSDWKELLEWYTNDKNKKTIETYIDKKISQIGKENEIEGDVTLSEKIAKYDDGTIKNKLTSVADIIDSTDYGDFLTHSFQYALEKYGNPYDWNDDSVKIQIDLLDFGFDLNELDEYFDNCDNNPLCVFNELISEDQIDMPKVDTDYEGDLDKDYYNELLSDYLNELINETINQKKIVNLLKEYNEKYSPLIVEGTFQKTLESIINELLSELKTEAEDDETNFRKEVYYWIEDVNGFEITKITKRPSINNPEKKAFMLNVIVEVNSGRTPTIGQLNPIIDQLELKLKRLMDTGDYYLLEIQNIINVNKINPW
jgi:hypothetical protein